MGTEYLFRNVSKLVGNSGDVSALKDLTCIFTAVPVDYYL